MVDRQIVLDLRVLKGDIMDYALNQGGLAIDKARDWGTVIEHIASQLELPHCQECGFAMVYDGDLQAYVCPRHEE